MCYIIVFFLPRKVRCVSSYSQAMNMYNKMPESKHDNYTIYWLILIESLTDFYLFFFSFLIWNEFHAHKRAVHKIPEHLKK